MLLETKKQRELLLTSLNEKRAGNARPFLYIMKLNTVPLILLLCLCSLLVTAQKETAVWYFGYGCGLDFNYNPPKVLNDGAIATLEGNSSICDSNGNLLFYTDGVSVWNRNHQLMPNGTGLMGHFSSAQSALIVKQPENDSIYYIFTTDACYVPFNNYGLRYSKVNMNHDDGYGAVILKNILVHFPSSERLNAVLDTNGKDVLIYGYVNEFNSLLSIKLTNDSLFGPFFTYVQTTIIEGQSNQKLSPNGHWLALTDIQSNIGKIVLCKRDSIKFNVALEINLSKLHIHSTEFSSDSRFLFYYNIKGDTTTLFRLDLTKNNIIETKRELARIKGYLAGMQVSYDKNIYFIVNRKFFGPTIDSSWVGVIYYPDDTARTYVEEKKYVFENSNKLWGALPNFVQSYFDPFFQARLRNDTVLCNGTPIKLGFYPCAHLQWSTGDTASEIVVDKEGEYSVIAIHPQNPGWKMYDTVTVAYKPCSGRCNQLQVAPNPNTGAFEIQLEKARKGSFQLYTTTGKQIGTWQVEEAHGLPLQLNLNLSPGMYLLRYITAECNEIVKFIVLRE